MAESGPRLKLREATGEETIVALNKDEIKIGRHGENDIKIRDPFVSRVHAQIFRDGNQFRVHDCDSKSGTYVNGERIKSQPLKHGDRIQLSHNEFPELTFLISDEVISSESFLNSIYSTSLFKTSSSASDLQHVRFWNGYQYKQQQHCRTNINIFEPLHKNLFFVQINEPEKTKTLP